MADSYITCGSEGCRVHVKSNAEARREALFTARSAINDELGPVDDFSGTAQFQVGTMDCPVCGEEEALGYRRDRLGQIAAKCRNGCVDFNEIPDRYVRVCPECDQKLDRLMNALPNRHEGRYP